ncbi:hypothetical protein PI124_g19153 [Phytophthora idaei]|nr:hypothetical protein PI126_g18521 [Phytophthora idaei]KAG3235822.1 hypothetical protein PI124_g19153 [Phytophthora idaei]
MECATRSSDTSASIHSSTPDMSTSNISDPPDEPDVSTSRAVATPTAASLPQLYIEKLVAYSPAKQPWLSGRTFDDAGTAYIFGHVSRFDKKKGLFQVQWLNTQFQKADKWVSMSFVQRGVENYKM